jgi:sugar (pentulose or hexulose) kinase
VVATDADGRPLRPAITWMDVCADWAIQRLTGEAATSVNTASGKYYDDRDEGGFPAGLLYPATRDVMH